MGGLGRSHMIIDAITNISKYACTHLLFARAIEYIASTDLFELEPGTYTVVEDELRAIISDGPGKTKEESLQRLECHDQFIDIQLVISGVEEMGWKPRGNCVSPKGEYDADKDVLFYEDAPDMFFTLHPGQFVIFFPDDVHAPMISSGNIKKLVMKIRV